MDSLTLSSNRSVGVDIDSADFATRRELFSFACASNSARGWSALIAEFGRREHKIKGPVRIVRASLQASQSGFVLGGLAWKELAAAGWSDGEIAQAGVGILLELQKRIPSAAEVEEKEGFSEASEAPGTSGLTP